MQTAELEHAGGNNSARFESTMLPLSALQLSQTTAQIERRNHFDPARLAELAESIKAVGLLAPIVARQAKVISTPGLNGLTVAGKTYFSPDEAEKAAQSTFEIVAGERRFMAATKAGLDQVPVSVRELTDEQVLEVQLVENLQREDLHELAEAEGYEGLMKLGHSAEEMADKVGKSKATIYARMKLLTLCKEARKAFYDGKLNSSTALLLARIPGEALQKQALKEITSRSYGDDPIMSVRQASAHIHSNYMLRLGNAGFKTSDATLVPAAGACGPCPKRTGNSPDLFGDVKGADVCTDPACFKSKLTAHVARAKAEAEDRGQKVITGADAKKVAPYGVDSSLQGFVNLDARDYNDKKSRTYRQILGKNFEPTLLQDPASGKLVEVAPSSAVKKVSPASSVNPQAAQDRKQRLEAAYRAELFKQVRAAAMARSSKLLRSELGEAALRLFDRLDHDATRRLAKVLEWKTTDPPVDIAEMNEATLAQFIRDCTLAHELYAPSWSNAKPEMLEDAAADLKIDTKQIRLQVADAKKPAAKKAPANAAKKKPVRKAK